MIGREEDDADTVRREDADKISVNETAMSEMKAKIDSIPSVSLYWPTMNQLNVSR